MWKVAQEWGAENGGRAAYKVYVAWVVLVVTATCAMEAGTVYSHTCCLLDSRL